MEPTEIEPDARPLDGLRVVEFAHMVMGPTCGLVLADLGATVIKVEPMPDGDKTRRLTGSGAGFFPTYNRNKRSLLLDVKHPDGIRIARRLIAAADVLVENFRPGAMDRLGLGYERVHSDNPGLIYMSAKGFLAGPYADRTALDEVVQMMGGLAYMTGPPGRPLRAGASVNDVMGGMFGAIAILAALRERNRTGRGQLVESALFENCAFLVAQHMAQMAVTGTPAPPMPNRLSAWAVYDVFDCADGAQVFVAVVTDSQWGAFCKAFGFEAWLDDPTLVTNPQRCDARDRFLPEIRTRFAKLSQSDLMAECARIGLPYAPIAKPEDLFDDPHLGASGGLLDIALPAGGRTRLPGLPIAMDGRRFSVREDVPQPGAHTRAILDDLGYGPDEVDRLVASGVVGVG